MVDSNISTHVMVKPCFQGIEQDNMMLLNIWRTKFLAFFFLQFFCHISWCFYSLSTLETCFLTPVFSPSVPDYSGRGEKCWRSAVEDCRPDLTWSGLCLAQLNHHMSEFVTKFLDQQIKYKVRFKIIFLSAQRTAQRVFILTGLKFLSDTNLSFLRVKLSSRWGLKFLSPVVALTVQNYRLIFFESLILIKRQAFPSPNKSNKIIIEC